MFTITISVIRLIEIGLDIVLSLSCTSRRVERSLSTHSEKHVHRLSLVTEGFFILNSLYFDAILIVQIYSIK